MEGTWSLLAMEWALVSRAALDLKLQPIDEVMR